MHGPSKGYGGKPFPEKYNSQIICYEKALESLFEM